jgi:hypothetical protein
MYETATNNPAWKKEVDVTGGYRANGAVHVNNSNLLKTPIAPRN